MLASAAVDSWSGPSISSLAIALLALVISGVGLPFTVRAAIAAVRQTKLQSDIADAAAQPYVWADIRPDETSGALIYLMVENNGPTVATNVRVRIEPPLEVTGDTTRVRNITDKLARGISSLPPGRRIRWHIDTGPNLGEAGALISYTLTVDADGPRGPIDQLEYVVALEDIALSSGRPAGSLHDLQGAVEQAGEKIKRAVSRPS